MQTTQKLNQFTTQYDCCKRCVGRVLNDKGSTDLDSSIQSTNTLDPSILKKLVQSQQCQICEGIVDRTINYLDKVLEELEDYEFQTFLVGCRLDSSIEKNEKKYKDFNLKPNSIKYEIRKEVGLRIVKSLDKTVDFEYPNITVIINAEDPINFSLEIRSEYILGRYQKLKRGIPQTKWPCSNCRGKGCKSCNQTGQQYPLSVETAISPPFIAASKATDSSFHGAGREDIDALMLGSGRPFVLELKEPKIRKLNLDKLKNEVNNNIFVNIDDLRFCEKDIIQQLKQGAKNTDKTYRALVNLEQPITEEQVDILKEFGSTEQVLQQKTPIRVSHRRADKVRKKIIYQTEVRMIDRFLIELEIKAQGGAYIKEFISGDEDRTIPSISSIINNQAKCVELDVINVDDRGLF